RATAGRGHGVVIVGREVTDAWLVEEAVRGTEQRYRMLFERSSDLLVIGTTSGRIVEANETAVRVSGYPQAELQRLTLLDLVEPGDRARAAAAMAEVNASGRTSCTLNFRARDGRRVVLDLSVARSVGGHRTEVLAIGRDITERSAIEAAVRESEARYRAVFEAVGDAVFVESLDGRILDANENACRMFGYTREELLNRLVADLVPEEARAWLPSVSTQLATRAVFHGEAVNVRKDGTRFPVEVSMTSMELAQGRMVLAVVRDISERHQARRALEESEQRHRSVFEATGAATMIIEEDTRLSLVNREFERLSGYTREEVLGTSWTLYVHPDDVERMVGYHRARRSVPGSAPREYDFRLIDRSGRVRDCRLVVEMIPGTGRSVASFLDVTEQRRTERMLAESEERYRTLFRDVPVGIYRTTPDGRVVMINPYLLRVLGLGEAEALELDLEKEGFGPQYRRSEFRAAVEQGEVRGLECEWVRRDGTTVFVRENARALRDESGRVLYYEGTVEDITERRAVERALEESEEHFRALAENAGDAILVAVGDGRHVYVNPRAAALTGYETGELLAMRFHELAHPDEVPMLKERYRRRQAGEAVPGSYRTAIRHRNGTRVEVEVSASRITRRGESGTLVIVHDVSEQVQLERALCAERDRLRLFLDVVGVVVVALDQTG
ncbi:PAS domain S-box protein, partial [candidate division WOR-3 bacterium]|nr:PAS domain S-box protein [candidate division WOR-3 bacterium]